MTRKQTVRDQAIAAVGGLVGGALGTLAGPEVALTGAAAGSVGALLAAKYAPEFFQNTIWKRSPHSYPPERENRVGLRVLVSRLTRLLNQAMKSADAMLKVANATEPSIGTLESRLARGFRWSLPPSDLGKEIIAQCITRLGDYCRTNGPIRVGCPALCGAAISIFRDLHGRFADSAGLQFAVSCAEINGREFFEALRTACDLDFAVGPLEALVLTDPERKLPLRVYRPNVWRAAADLCKYQEKDRISLWRLGLFAVLGQISVPRWS